jgi:hypothetical protein
MESRQMNNVTSTLYEQDYYVWLEKTSSLLRDGRLSELDIPHLIEEIEDMGRSERRVVRSNLIVILMHLLKYKYQLEKRSNSWLLTIFERRRRLRDDFADSPSLKRYFNEVFEQCYKDARISAAIETGIPTEVFPEQSLFTPEEVLNIDYLPE